MSKTSVFFAILVSVAGASIGYAGESAPPNSPAANAVKVTTDKTVDASSLDSIVQDVFRLSGAKTNDEKAIAIYNYFHGVEFHLEYPKENKQTIGPLKYLNVYGWGLCGGQHTALKALFETAGWQCRFRGWSQPGHTTVETYYDDKWHWFDTFLKCYYWNKDKTAIAGQDDIVKDPSIVLDAVKEERVPKNNYVCCGDDPKAFPNACATSKTHEPIGPEKGWTAITGRDSKYSPLLSLSPGATLRLTWGNQPGMMVSSAKRMKPEGTHGCKTKDFRSDPVLGPVYEHYGPRAFANGAFTYAPDFAKPADLTGMTLSNAKAEGGKLVATGTGSAVFNLNLPYPYASCRVEATFEGGDGKVLVSTDEGKTWTDTAGPKPVPADGEPSEPLKAAMAAPGDVTPFVRQKYNVSFKAEFPGTLAKFAVNAVVQHNRGVLPYLVNGKNVVTVTTKDNLLPAESVLVVTYAYQEATAPEGRKRYEGLDVKYGDAKTVTKEITQLPCTFEVDVGGNTPPKMLYLERMLKAK